MQSLHLFIFTLDGIIVRGTLIRWYILGRVTIVCTGCACCACLTINHFTNLMEGLLQRFARRFDTLDILCSEGGIYISDLRLQLALLLWSKLVTQFTNALFRAIGRAISKVPLFHFLLAALIVGC